MIRAVVLLGGFALSACAQSQPSSILPIQPVDPIVTPVAFKELRGQSVMVLDRTAPDFAVRRVTSYLRACKTASGERLVLDANGLQLVDRAGRPKLILMVAQRGPVTGLALDGPDFTPAYQEELSRAIEGRSTCA